MDAEGCVKTPVKPKCDGNQVPGPHLSGQRPRAHILPPPPPETQLCNKGMRRETALAGA